MTIITKPTELIDLFLEIKEDLEHYDKQKNAGKYTQVIVNITLERGTKETKYDDIVLVREEFEEVLKMLNGIGI